jgi:hypothetical protein
LVALGARVASFGAATLLATFLVGGTLAVTREGWTVAGADAEALGGADGAGGDGAGGTAAGADAVGGAVAAGRAVGGVTADDGADAGRFAGEFSDVECVAKSSM